MNEPSTRSAETRAKASAAAKRNWADPEYRRAGLERLARARAARGALDWSAEACAIISARVKNIWADPTLRAARIEALRAAAASPEARARRSAYTRALFADPARRAARLAAMQAGRAAMQAGRAAKWAREGRVIAPKPPRREKKARAVAKPARLSARPPAWVPRDLRQEFVDAAKLYGAEKAASIVRAMMAEA